MSVDANHLVKSSTSFTLAGPNENGEYELRSSEGVLHQIRGVEGKSVTTAELSRGSDVLLNVKKSSGSGEWIVYNTGFGTVYNFSHVSESLLAEKLKALQDQADQQAAAISKYATYAKWPTVPDFGAIFGLPDRSNNEPLDYIPGLDPTIIDRINAADEWIKSKSDITIYTYDRADAGSYEKLLDLENQYVSILKECGFTASMKSSAAGGRELYYSKGNVSVSLGWNEPHRDWTSPRNPGSKVNPDHLHVSVQSSK